MLGRGGLIEIHRLLLGLMSELALIRGLVQLWLLGVILRREFVLFW
mgnify:CR=1 FL=1